jgi:uncharacterized protein with von Willebrand factor type A (vWA) domain
MLHPCVEESPPNAEESGRLCAVPVTLAQRSFDEPALDPLQVLAQVEVRSGARLARNLRGRMSSSSRTSAIDITRALSRTWRSCGTLGVSAGEQ